MMKFDNKGIALSSFISCLAILIIAVIVVAFLAPGWFSNEYLSNSVQAARYRSYEERCEKAAKKYINQVNNNVEGSQIILNIIDLSISKSIKNECSGYVIVNMAVNPISSRAYLSCGTYTTPGY